MARNRAVMPSEYPPPSTCSGTTCYSSPIPIPPIPHRQSPSLADAPRYSPNGLQARGRVVRCYLQVCYVMTEPDAAATAVVGTDTPAPISPAASSHTSPRHSGSTPLPLFSMFTDTPNSKAEASAQSDLAARTRGGIARAVASSSSSGLASADPSTATTAPSGTFQWETAIERRSGAAAAVLIISTSTSIPTLADPPMASSSSLPAFDVVATSSDSVSPTPTSTSAPSTSTSGSKLSTAAIVRIAIGAAVGAGFLSIALICLVARWRNRRRAARLAARRKPYAGPEAYGMASRSQDEGREGLGRTSSDSSTIVSSSVVDHDGYGRGEFGMAGGGRLLKDSERV
ncbi:hypothetical protein V8D89_001287 [Ganoderma adspersum]